MLDGNDKILRRISGRPDKELVPSTDQTFIYDDTNVDVVFEKDDAGFDNRMILNLLGTPYLGFRQ